jgi:hypothetical protein
LNIVFTYYQGRNFNEKTGGAEALLSFSCSLMVIDTRKSYNSTVTKIFGKYMNISKFKLFTLILYFYCAYNELPVCKQKCFILWSLLDSDWSDEYYGFIMMFIFYLFNTFSDRNTGPKVFFRTFLDFKLACGGTLDRSFFKIIIVFLDVRKKQSWNGKNTL